MITKEISPQIQQPELSTIINAARVQEDVRSRLVYVPGANPDSFRDSGESTCIGYTILGSEKLEETGIDHSVGYINGHATLLLNTEKGRWLLDMLAYEMNQPIEYAVLTNDSEANGRKLVWVNAHNLLEQTDLGWEEGPGKYPWLALPQKAPSTSRIQDSGASAAPALLMSIFSPELGRKVIYEYAKFKNAYDNADLAEASDALVAMAGIFPEADIRSEAPSKVKSIVKRLAIAHDFDRALATTNAFFDSFDFSQDSRVEEYRADCLRYIARHSGQKNVAATAIELYKHAKSRPHSFNGSISAKLDLCAQLAA